MSMKLGERHERWTHAILAALYFTGLAWVVVRYGIADEGVDSAWSIVRAWLLRAHGAAAMVTLIAFGSLLAVHVPWNWRAHANTPSGVGMLTVISVLTVTGWLLYYAAAEWLREWSSSIHITLGVGTPLVLLWHLAYRRRASLSRTFAPRRS